MIEVDIGGCLAVSVIVGAMLFADITFRLSGKGKNVEWFVGVKLRAKLDVLGQQVDRWIARIIR